MKTTFGIYIAVAFFLNSGGLLYGAPTDASPKDSAVPPPTAYSVVGRDANSRVWEQTTYKLSPSGGVVPQKHRYVELATGLHYKKNGLWVESKEEIDILPNGTAAATQGQHQAHFPGNIYEGVIELVTPDGGHLQSRPLGLSYDDGTHTVLIAELTNSVGYLVGPNQVIYPDAFTDFKADLRYTYTKAGFEQDIILREQPQTPESYGLNPATARLQVLTEFFNSPQPAKTTRVLPKQAGIALNDENLDFGAMKMMPGRTFLLGTDAHEGGALVGKSWVKLEGRQFLVEEVPVDALADELAQLPVPQTASTKPNVNSMLHVVSAKRVLPAPRLTKTSPSGSFKQVAQAAVPARGLVLDYQTLNNTQTNYTFQGDTTYYISGPSYSFGTNTFEGGAVLKFATNGSLVIAPGPPGTSAGINWKAGAYRPVIFTAKDDNTVGESIGTGNPTGYYGNPMLNLGGFSPQTPLTGLRMSYAKIAIQSGGVNANFYNVQFVNCQNGLTLGGGSMLFANALFANTTTNFILLGGCTITAQNATFSGSRLLAASSTQNGACLALTNCILANVTNILSGVFYTTNGNYNGFYNAPYVSNLSPVSFTNSFYPFQSVGAGNYYLTNGCGFQNVGTTNIDSTLLSALRQKTTYPPIVYSNVTISVNTTLSPQAQRDTDTPDLGYHYDPIDYIADALTITNAALTVTNGAVIANYNRSGIQLQTGSSMVSMGTPLVPNRFVRYQSVQEQSIVMGGTNLTSALSINPNHPGNTGPTATFRFTQFACPAAGGSHLFDAGSTNYNSLLVQDCEFWGGQNTLPGSTGTIATLRNNLFYRSIITAAGTNLLSKLSLTNNLVFGALVSILQSTNNNKWSAFNNDFDSCSLTNCTLTNGYNAYLNCSGRLQPTNVANDVVSSNGLAYQTGPLGGFYQPAGSPLIDKGNTNANLLGLYHYTAQTNQVKETNSTVDIGYHYVAVDTNGNPVDSNGDGIPDYIQDANGNGLVDAGETNWGLAILTPPVSQVVPQGTNVTFAVTAGGIAPLSYQWRFNTTNLLFGATNSSLTLTNVQTTNAGNYSVVVTNVAGSMTSSNAVLTVNVLPVITQQPVNVTTNTGGGATFSVTVSTNNTAPLSYQWRKNGSNLVNGGKVSGANSSTLTLTNVNPRDAGIYNVVVTNAAGSVASLYAVLRVWTPSSVVAWGYDGNGQIEVPVYLTNVLAVAGGYRHSLALKGNGTVVGWGLDDYGQTDVPSGLTNVVTVAGGYQHSLALKGDGTVVGWGFDDYGETNVPSGLTNVVAIAAGGYHNLALKYDGTMVGWGLDDDGEADVPSGLMNVVAIAAGGYHSLALKGDGTVMAWGDDPDGETDVPSGLTNVVAIAAGGHHSLALKGDGTAVGWGFDNDGETDVPSGLTNVVAIAGGGYHSLALGNLPPGITVQPQSQTAVVGDDVTFSVIVVGSSPLNCQWYFNSTKLANATNWTLILSNVSTNNTGGYHIVVTNKLGLVTSSNAALTVNVPPVITQQPVNVTTNTGGGAMFSVMVSTNSTLPLSYQWYFNNGILIDATNATLALTNVQPGQAGIYSAALANVAGSVTSSNAVLTVVTEVNTAPVLPPQFNRTIHGKLLMTVTNTATDSDIPANLLTYSLLVKPIGATIDTNGVISWTPVTSQVPSTNTITTVVTDNGFPNLRATNSFTVVVTTGVVNSPPWLPPQTNRVVNEQTTLVVTNTGMDSNIPANALTYRLAVTNLADNSVVTNASIATNGIITWTTPSQAQSLSTNRITTVVTDNGVPNLSATNSFTVIVKEVIVAPVITQQPVSQMLFLGNTAIFFVTTTGTHLSYQWCFNGTNVVAATNASLTLVNIQTTDAGNYSVVITNVAGSATSSNATLAVMSLTGDSDYDGVNDPQEIADGTDPFNPDSVISVRLGYWRFDDTNTWVGDAGQLPLLTTNVLGVPSWNTNWNDNAAMLDSTNAVILKYRDVETNSNPNINLRNGTVRFWFRPDWNSAAAGGTGPGAAGRLIEMGKQGTNTGWWTLMLNTNGNVLSFVTQTNGVGMTNFNALVNLNSNLWHQIVLTYGTSNSVLYLDGRAITNGTGVQYYPNATERANGFRVGSDESGTNQARGIFDELETFNYALTASVILANYNQVSTESSAIGSSYFSILLVAPTNNAAYAEPATILLQASVVDLDSTATNVEFFRGFIGITGTATIPYQYSWPIVAAGQYSLTAVAYGAGGLSVTSAPVSITVTNLCGN